MSESRVDATPIKDRPLVLVLDDEWATSDTLSQSRRPALEKMLGEFVTLRGQKLFTKESIGRGETGHLISPQRLADLAPSALVVDLQLVPELGSTRGGLGGSPEDGINVIRSIQENDALSRVPLFVLSNYAEAYRNILQTRLGIPASRIFLWDQVQNDQETARKFVSEILRAISVTP